MRKNIIYIAGIAVALILGTSATAAQSGKVVAFAAGEKTNLGTTKVIQLPGNVVALELWESGAKIENGILKGGNAWKIASVSGTSYSWKVGDVQCGGKCTVPANGQYKIVGRDNKGNVLDIGPIFGIGVNVPVYAAQNSQIQTAAVAAVTPVPASSNSNQTASVINALRALLAELAAKLASMKK